eukprot:scaffold71050_cov43-Phaeocystis_antarctica.AAC.2
MPTDAAVPTDADRCRSAAVVRTRSADDERSYIVVHVDDTVDAESYGTTMRCRVTICQPTNGAICNRERAASKACIHCNARPLRTDSAVELRRRQSLAQRILEGDCGHPSQIIFEIASHVRFDAVIDLNQRGTIALCSLCQLVKCRHRRVTLLFELGVRNVAHCDVSPSQHPGLVIVTPRGVCRLVE